MTTIKVGGLGFGRKKTIQDANKDVRSGDVVEICSSQMINQPSMVEIHSDVTFEGNDKVISIDEQTVGFILNANADVVFQNMTVNLGPKCNFLSVTENANGSVTFSNVTFEFSSKMDIRDGYPPIGNKSEGIRFIVEHSTIPYVMLVAGSIQIKDSSIGTVAGQMSKLLSSHLQVVDSELSHVLLQAQYADKEGQLSLNNCTSQGRLIITEMIGSVDGLAFKPLERNGRLVDSSKVFDQFFLSPIYKPDNPFIQQLILRNTGQSDRIHLRGISYANLEDKPYEGYALTVEGSKVFLEETNIPMYNYKNTINNSSLSLERVIDRSQWVVDGDVKISTINSESELSKYSSSGSNMTAIEEIESFVGLRNVKEQLTQMVSLAKMNSERKSRGLSTTKGFSMHMIFSGSAGTGKTTMAKLFGRALYENGILPSSEFVVATRKDFVAGYVGQTATKTHDLIESARGGVLFVDEAYALTPQESGNDFATEAVDQLVMDSEEYREEMVIILAGYTNEMTHFIEHSNTGLKSRFKNWVEFPDYDKNELVEILKFTLDGQGVVVSKPVWMKLKQSFKRIYEVEKERGGKLDGNARYVRNYVQDLIMQKDLRLSRLNDLENVADEALMTLSVEDIQHVEDQYI